MHVANEKKRLDSKNYYNIIEKYPIVSKIAKFCRKI